VQGRAAVVGAIAGPIVQLDVRTLFGCTVLAPHVFQNPVRIIEQGRISPVVARTFDPEEIRDAQQMFLVGPPPSPPTQILRVPPVKKWDIDKYPRPCYT
jgi:hypothetical protein